MAEQRRQEIIKEALDRVDEYSFTRVRLLLFDLMGLEWKRIYESDSYNKYYDEFKEFMQNKSYDSFGMWILVTFIFQILTDYQTGINIWSSLYEHMLTPLIIIIVYLSKNKQRKYFESETNFYLQNFIISFVGIYITLKDSGQGLGMACVMGISAVCIESIIFKLITLFVVLGSFILSNIQSIPLILSNLMICIMIVMGIILQELNRYQSFTFEYNQLEQDKKQMKNFINVILEERAKEYQEQQRLEDELDNLFNDLEESD